MSLALAMAGAGPAWEREGVGSRGGELSGASLAKDSPSADSCTPCYALIAVNLFSGR